MEYSIINNILLIENSGEILTIKKSHPFQKHIYKPTYEFPVQNLVSSRIEKGLFYSYLVLEVYSESGTNKILWLNLSGFSKQQYDKLSISLQKC